jgi:hypothetical protein
MALNAVAGDYGYLSPRAAGNQIKHAPGIRNDPDLVAVDQGLALPPRPAGNEAAIVAGTNNDVNTGAICAKTMTGSPKAVQQCIESGTMSGCKANVMVAPLK